MYELNAAGFDVQVALARGSSRGSILQLLPQARVNISALILRVNIAAVIGCNYCLAPNPLHSNMDIGPGGIPLGTIIWFILQQCTSSEQQLEHLCCNILTSHNELIVHDGDTRT